MTIRITRSSIDKIKLTLYVFIAVFQPPFLPVSLIYVTGVINFFLLLMYDKHDVAEISINSGIRRFEKLIFGLFLYTLIVSFIDFAFVENQDLLGSRVRTINQLVVLTLIEISSVIVVIKMTKKYSFSMDDVLESLIYAALIQGLCGVAAYLVPSIRSAFVRFGDQALYSNMWVWERRGYGFSSTLIDTFGYGMGLLGGITLFYRKKTVLFRAVTFALICFSVLVNARTGIVILGIAILIEFAITAKGALQAVIRIAGTIIAVYLAVNYLIPVVLDYGLRSENVTFNWAAKGIEEFYLTLFSSGNRSLSGKTFVSHLNIFPSNFITLIFGSGHTIYDTASTLGFRTDVGFINAIWAYGILGTAIYEIAFAYLFYKAFKGSDVVIKKIILLLAISYYVLQVKAILIGYNPGVMVTYFIVFATMYFNNHSEFAVEALSQK